MDEWKDERKEIFTCTGVGKIRFTILSTKHRVNKAIVIIKACMSFSIQAAINLLLPTPIYMA